MPYTRSARREKLVRTVGGSTGRWGANTIENLHGCIKRVSGNVKRWRSGSMVVRWAVTALIEADVKSSDA